LSNAADLSKRIALSEKDVAMLYGIPVTTLRTWRWANKGPKYYKCGKSVKYRREDVESFVFSTPVLTADAI